MESTARFTHPIKTVRGLGSLISPVWRANRKSDAASAASATHFGAAEFHRKNAVTLEADIFDADFFAGEFFLGRCFDNRRATFATEQQAGRVRLRIATDQ